MSIERLQAAIREKKTPVALGLAPEIDKVPAKILKNFEDMFGPGMMANAEALRFHGCQAMDAAQGKLPAVVISAEHYLRYGMMGADVLSHRGLPHHPPGAVAHQPHGRRRLHGDALRGR